VSRIYVGPTALYDLGQVGELDLLTSLDGTLVVPDEVAAEVDVEPARTALEHFLEAAPIETDTDVATLEKARSVLGDDAPTSSAAIVAGLLAHRDPDDRTVVAVVSEDRRLRRVGQGLGASVTSSFGVVIRAALSDPSIKPGHVKRIVKRMDRNGLHMTGEMRERAVGEAGG